MPAPSSVCIPTKISGQITTDPANISAASVLKHSMTIPGVKVGDVVFVQAPSLENNLSLGDAYVSAANTVIVRIINPTAGAINPASQTFFYEVV